MKAIVELDRIELNIVNLINIDTIPARYYLNKKNKEKMKKTLNLFDNKFLSFKTTETFTEIVKTQFGNTIVNVGNEQINYKIPKNLFNLIDYKIEKNIFNFNFEMQSLIFKIKNFDKFITFKVMRDWKETQGQVENKSYNFFRVIKDKLLSNDFKLDVEIYKDKKTGYYLIKKVY